MITARNAYGMAGAASACCVLLSAFSSSAWAQAGYVHEVSGLVSIKNAAGKAVAAKPGDQFDANTVCNTGADGKVMLKFADGQVVALGANSGLRIGQYHYDPASRAQNSSTVELMKGEMRFVAGLIGASNREGVRVIAGESMIGIQSPGGADFTVAVRPGAQEAGYVAVARGEISARTPSGEIARIATSQYAPWRPGRTSPLPLPLAAAPATVQASVAALWAAVLPASAPVEIASAARTAAATAALGPAMAAVGAAPSLAGYVARVSDAVSVQTSSGGKGTPVVGTTFQRGATFSTGADEDVVLKFADGQIVALGPDSLLAVSQYRFDPGDVKASRSVLDLVNGSMRIITGSIHTENHEGISITAGASTIDILNTGPADFTVVVDTRNQEVGVARVSLGEISVHTPYGLIDKIKTGQSSLWGPKTPASPVAVAATSALLDAVVALPVPDNMPVAVVSAARAAAAVADANRAQAAANANPNNAQLQAAAQEAKELANLATQAATAAIDPGITAKAIATMLQDLPPTAAGPVLAQAPAAAAAFPGATTPFLPTVSPGAGGGCTGSRC